MLYRFSKQLTPWEIDAPATPMAQQEQRLRDRASTELAKHLAQVLKLHYQDNKFGRIYETGAVILSLEQWEKIKALLDEEPDPVPAEQWERQADIIHMIENE